MAKKNEGKSFLRRKYFNFSEVQIIILNSLATYQNHVVKFSKPEITLGHFWPQHFLSTSFLNPLLRNDKSNMIISQIKSKRSLLFKLLYDLKRSNIKLIVVSINACFNHPELPVFNNYNTIVYYSLKSYNTISSLLYNSPPP